MGLKKKAAVAPVADEPVEDTPKVSKPAKKAAPAPETAKVEEPAEQEVEQETVQETVQEPTQQSTQEVAAPAATQVATRSTGALAQAAEEGFEGLDIGFGSFPILKINGDSFEIDDEELEDKSIQLQIMQSRAKFIIKQVDKGEDAEFIYSYDKVTATDGSLVSDWVNSQAMAGEEIEYKQYIEAVAEIHEEGAFEGDIVILSIPPSGVKRFSGYVATLKMKRNVVPSAVITRAEVGKKIKKGKISWSPWVFKFAQMAED